MRTRSTSCRPLGVVAVAMTVAMITACEPMAVTADRGSPVQGSTMSGSVAGPPVSPPAEMQAIAPVPELVSAPAGAPAPEPAPVSEQAVPAPAGVPGPAGYPFGAASVWRADISSTPIAENSASMVSYLAESVADRYGGVAALNISRYNNSYFVAAPGTPTVDVGFNDCQGKGYVPGGLIGPGGQFTDVPIPAAAVPAAGDDKAMSVYSPVTDQLWEFWVAGQDDNGRWTACWGGRIDAVSHSVGYFLGGFGASASGLATTGGMVGLDDVRFGSIEHALALQIPEPAARLSWPAQRTDGGNTHPHAVPEGTRLRLDPSLDVDGLGLHPIAAMIARAAQRYGFIVTDHAGAVAVVAESGVPEAAATGVDPWEQLLEGTAEYEVLENFPWDRLQALPADYGKP